MFEISVLMSTYNEKERDLRAAVDSILKQTYSNFEFIIILDKPENTLIKKILDSYDQADQRIKFYINEENLGLPKSLNRAIALSKGKYIARMDADDIAFEFRLEKQYKYLVDNSFDLIGANYRLMSENGDKEYERTRNPINPEAIYRRLRENSTSCVGHPTWFARREVFEKLQGYRDIHTCEDYDFLLRACKTGFKLGNLEDVCLKYRLTSNSISRSNRVKQGLVSRFIREHYHCLLELDANDIENYLDSVQGKNDAMRYRKHLELCDQLQKFKKNRKWVSYFFCTAKIMLYSKYGREEVKRKIKQ